MWETKKSLQRELDNAEERVVFHYKRANKFERIIQKAIKTIELEQANKTPAVHIVDKIKKALVSDWQSNN